MKMICREQCALLFLASILFCCTNKEIPTGVDCSASGLSLALVTMTPASSCTTADGQVTVAASGGVAPFTYSINGGVLQANPAFVSMLPGTYAVLVKDSKSCTASTSVTITAANSTLAATSSTTLDTECFSPHNGSIIITPTGGVAPFQFKMDNGVFVSTGSFVGLETGPHTAVVMDSEGCSITLNITVPRGDTGTSYASQVQPIINANCTSSSCHGAGNGARDWTVFSNVFAKATMIKARTASRSMPPPGNGSLTAEQIQLIACWVDDGAKNN